MSNTLDVNTSDPTQQLIKAIGKKKFDDVTLQVDKVFSKCEIILNKMRSHMKELYDNNDTEKSEYKKKNILTEEKFIFNLMQLLLEILGHMKIFLRSDCYNKDITTSFRNKTTERVVMLMQRVQLINEDEAEKIKKNEILNIP